MPYFLRCPRCGYLRSWTVRRYHRKCKRCRREWSPHTHYSVRGFRLNVRDWNRIIDTFLRDGVAISIVRECLLSEKTAHRCATIIRKVMYQDVPAILSGIGEADETYVGGAWKNKRIHIRRQGTKRGRGTSKQAIFGIVSRDQKQARVWQVVNAKAHTTIPLICATVVRGSTIYTDGFKGYRCLPRYGYHHDWVDHDAGEYVRGDVHTQTLDGYWGLLKNWSASKGGVQRERLHLFIGEHLWRYNFRSLTRKEQITKIYMLLTRFGGKRYI